MSTTKPAGQTNAGIGSSAAVSGKRVFAVVMILAIVSRALCWPAANVDHDVDENVYLMGSLALVEGIPPGNKASPSGPNFWVGWTYTMALVAKHLAAPTRAERALPMQVRIFAVIDRTLFLQYRDMNPLHQLWIATQMLLFLAAVAGAVQIGIRWGGNAGGLLFGGMFALSPVFVFFTVMSRPYMTSWAFGLLALRFAVLSNGGRRVIVTGILYGLAVASRVEMLLFAPVILWAFWDRPALPRPFVSLLKMGIATGITTLLAAPWLLTNFLGTLRTIATVRFGPDARGVSFAQTLRLLCLDQGFGGALLLCAAGVFLIPFARERSVAARFKLFCLFGFLVLLILSLSGGTVFFHQQGPVLLALITVAAVVSGMGPINRLSEKSRLVAVTVVLLLPLGELVSATLIWRRNACTGDAAAWVARHIPAGTRVYTDLMLHEVLPTPAAADVLWEEVTNVDASKKKFSAGLERFHLHTDQLPRALSEENMVQERGNRRGEFILGACPDFPEPRYDVKLFNGLPLFGSQDPVSDFKKTGGVLILRGAAPDPALNPPAASLLAPSGGGIFIYVSGVAITPAK